MFETLLNINLNDIIHYFTFKDIKYFLLILFILLVLTIIIIIIISYIFIKFLKINIDNSNFLFYQYNKKCKKILDLYGNYKITNIYLVRHPIGNFITFLLNIFTLYRYEKLINESKDNFPYHSLILFEIKLEDGNKKMIILEKTNSINISENFLINNSLVLKKIKVKKNKFTINSILNVTRDRVGSEKFYNWHLYKNNCQEFTKEILKTIHKYNKSNKDFIFHDKLIKLIIPTEFTKHIANCLFVIYNIIQKYFIDFNFEI
jgi:hypothetical protein